MSDDTIPAGLTRDEIVRNMIGSQALQIATLTAALGQARTLIGTMTAELETVKKALDELTTEKARRILAGAEE
jgi:3-oxoacyl-(acyl-carrier-protein) synthase